MTLRGGDLVIVVDDDNAVRDALKFALELEGLDVLTFGSAAEVLTSPIPGGACFVIDYRMPMMDGLELATALGAKGHDARLAILIASRVTESLRREAAAAGITDVLEKPLDGAMLIDGIRHALDRRRSSPPLRETP